MMCFYCVAALRIKKPRFSEAGVKKASRNAKKTVEKKKLEDQMILWAESLKLGAVVLTNDKTDVQTLGGQGWNDVKNNSGKKVNKGIPTKVKKAFMLKNNIQIREAFRTVPLLGRNVAAYMNDGPARRAIAGGARKKSSSTAKPDCIQKEGTLYRVSNAVCAHEQGRYLFMQLRLPHDKEDLTGPGAKSIVYEGILKIYDGDDDDDEEGDVSLDELQVDMSGYPLDRYLPRTFDKLTLEEFLIVLSYYQRQIKGVMNDKRRSGSHGSAAMAAGNVHWQVYAVNLFESIGDKDFISCVDPVLSPQVMRSSSVSTRQTDRKGRRRRKNRRSQKTDDYDDNNEFLSKAASSTKAQKHSAMEAAEDAAIAITERNDELKHQSMTDR